MVLDWSQCTAVESVPGKVSGAWVFRGMRIPVAAVFENLEDGLTVDGIVQMFGGRTREPVKAVPCWTLPPIVWKSRHQRTDARLIRSRHSRWDSGCSLGTRCQNRKTTGMGYAFQW